MVTQAFCSKERIATLLLQSTARVVHFECDMLPSGGDLVLQWVSVRECL